MYLAIPIIRFDYPCLAKIENTKSLITQEFIFSLTDVYAYFPGYS